MGNVAKDIRLDTRESRKKLSKRREPYWRTLAKKRGWAIGYRKGEQGGYWIAKHYSKEHGRRFNKLGKADDDVQVPGVLTYEEAEEKARQWFAEVVKAGGGARQSPYTVRNAIEDYIEDYKGRGGKGLSRMEASINVHILPSLGNKEIGQLNQRSLKAWHEGLAKAPSRLRTKQGKPQGNTPFFKGLCK